MEPLITIYSVGLVTFFLGCFVLLLIFGGGWFYTRWTHSQSPFSTKALEKCSLVLSFSSLQKIHQFFQENNLGLFDPYTAAVCRISGRIFPHCVNSLGLIRLKKPYVRHYTHSPVVLYADLNDTQKQDLRDRYPHIDRYQTYTPIEMLKEPLLEKMKPGPLFVTRDSHNLIGWRLIPGTTLEILIKESNEVT